MSDPDRGPHRRVSEVSNSTLAHRRLLKATEIIRYALVRGAAALLGFKPRHRAPDRVLLDEQILPKLAACPQYERVLFVGCDWYTEHVADMFASRKYTTLEADPARARHGAADHIVGRLGDLTRLREGASFDLIVCNGVIGWGLDDPDEIARSLSVCASALAPGGLLLLGWDDVPEKRPIPIEPLVAAQGLLPATPPGLASSRIETGTYARHVFGFWERSARTGDPARTTPAG